VVKRYRGAFEALSFWPSWYFDAVSFRRRPPARDVAYRPPPAGRPSEAGRVPARHRGASGRRTATPRFFPLPQACRQPEATACPARRSGRAGASGAGGGRSACQRGEAGQSDGDLACPTWRGMHDEACLFLTVGATSVLPSFDRGFARVAGGGPPGRRTCCGPARATLLRDTREAGGRPCPLAWNAVRRAVPGWRGTAPEAVAEPARADARRRAPGSFPRVLPAVPGWHPGQRRPPRGHRGAAPPWRRPRAGRSARDEGGCLLACLDGRAGGGAPAVAERLLRGCRGEAWCTRAGASPSCKDAATGDAALPEGAACGATAAAEPES
jgi:hypothetical protein